MNSEQTTDLNVKPKTMELLKERTGEKLCGLVLGKDFLAMSPKEQTGKSNNKLYFLKIRNFYALTYCRE